MQKLQHARTRRLPVTYAVIHTYHVYLWGGGLVKEAQPQIYYIHSTCNLSWIGGSLFHPGRPSRPPILTAHSARRECRGEANHNHDNRKCNWHIDGATSILHLAVTLAGNRYLTVEYTESSHNRSGPLKHGYFFFQ